MSTILWLTLLLLTAVSVAATVSRTLPSPYQPGEWVPDDETRTFADAVRVLSAGFRAPYDWRAFTDGACVALLAALIVAVVL